MRSLSHLCLASVVSAQVALTGCANPSNEIASIAEKGIATARPAPQAVPAQVGPAKGQPGHDRRMDIVNQTDRAVMHFQATNTSIKKWGRDLLGQSVIPPGRSHRFDFNDGTDHCTFDFRAVLDNGRVVERYNVNVCSATAWILRAGPGRDAPAPAQPGGSSPKPAPKPSNKREIGA